MNHVIILAAGQGQRMASRKDKMLLLAAGKPVVYYTIMAFNDHDKVDSISIIVNKNNEDEIKKIVKQYNFRKVKNFVIGGLLRQTSLEKGISHLEGKVKDSDLVIVHNGANPLPDYEEIGQAIELAEEHGACIVGRALCSTIKEANKTKILKTHDRENLLAAETPQIVKFSLLQKGLEHAKSHGLEVTDEAMLMEVIDQPVAYIKSSENNFKITTQADLLRLKTVLGEMPEDVRMGIGQDSHEFEPGEKGLTIAGVYFENEKKLKANSDGDVIIHAMFNAFSQALGDKSLGFYADPMCERGIKDSSKYLDVILKKMHKKGFKINSLGLMLECKTPKIDPIVAKLKKSLSKILNLDVNRIGITATTGENLTAFGAGLGIQCFAIITMIKTEKVASGTSKEGNI